MYQNIIKRILDFVLAAIALLILWPLFLIIAFTIKIDSKGPVFFKQKRVGKDKAHFNIYKFRTMRADTPGEVPTHMLTGPDKFITQTGKFLRKSSLDELPQLFNVLKGEMSFIGPRPALWNQNNLINERDKYGVNSLYPGISGWAQVNGRDELPIEVKARYDGEYKDRINFVFDLKCILKTISGIVSKKGYAEGNK